MRITNTGENHRAYSKVNCYCAVIKDHDGNVKITSRYFNLNENNYEDKTDLAKLRSEGRLLMFPAPYDADKDEYYWEMGL